MCSRSEPETSISSSRRRGRCGRPRRARCVISPVRVAWRSVRRRSRWPRRRGLQPPAPHLRDVLRDRLAQLGEVVGRRLVRAAVAQLVDARVLAGALAELHRLRALVAAWLRRFGLALALRLGDRWGAGEVRGEQRIEGGNGLSVGDEGHACQPVEAHDVRRLVVAQRGQEVDPPLGTGARASSRKSSRTVKSPPLRRGRAPSRCPPPLSPAGRGTAAALPATSPLPH